MPSYKPKDLSKMKRKVHRVYRGRSAKVASERGSVLAFYPYGLQIIGEGVITSTQLDAIHATIGKELGKGKMFIIRLQAHTPVSAKPIGVRMGGGKGDISKWVCWAKVGTVALEIDGNDDGSNRSEIHSVLSAISKKLPIKTRIIERIGIVGGQRI
jgi:large subunit ribosomal protein L16